MNKWGPRPARTSNGLAHDAAPAGRDEDEEAQKMGSHRVTPAPRPSPNFETGSVARLVDPQAFLTNLIFTGSSCFRDFHLKELRVNLQETKS